MSDFKLCKNVLCRQGKDHNRKPIPKEGPQHCSPACGTSSRNQRFYVRKQAGIKVVKCEPCEGTGYVETGKTGN